MFAITVVKSGGSAIFTNYIIPKTDAFDHMFHHISKNFKGHPKAALKRRKSFIPLYESWRHGVHAGGLPPAYYGQGGAAGST